MSIKKYLPKSLINYGRHLPTSLAANLLYQFPSQRLKVIGVTGTDGKTTTVNLIYQILKDAGKKVSMISTINAVIAGKSYDTGFHVTSPSPFEMQGYIKKAVDHGDEYLVLEVTSHAIDQFRTWGIPFYIGVITNITREHLDYHKTYEHYVQTKAKLIKQAKFAVLNKDDANFATLKKQTTGQVIPFSVEDKVILNLKIPGEYNRLNALAALSVARILEIDQARAIKSLESFTSLVGRMQEIPNKLGISIIVDFAHTPNALENALKTLRLQTKGRLISVFGAASERDDSKRPLMGKISGELADMTILTNEDPRHEDPNNIIDEIASGAIKGGAVLGETLYKLSDRNEAIRLALKLAKRGDCIGIFGKGHETSMNIGGKELPWSDQKSVKEALLGHRSGEDSK